MKLINLIYEELDPKGKLGTVKYIYNYIFKNALNYCKDIDSFQCHTTVNFIKNNKDLKKNWWYKDIKYHIWNESHWNKVGSKLKKDNKNFSNKHINNLIEDISDGSVNGHSFMSFQGYFIDPYLKYLNVRDNDIQKFDKYFLSVM